MNITFLIGNGFDLNLGLRTRYCDFYEYYQKCDSSNPIIKLLKENINKDRDWSDLELTLGEYTTNINSLEEVDCIFDDIREELAQYIIEEQERCSFNISMESRKKIYSDLIYPELYLPSGSRSILQRHKTNISDYRNNINIISFNYSTVLDKVLGYTGNSVDLKDNSILTELIHIHGTVHRDMILGVNDSSQIKNENLSNNPDIIDTIVKKECNRCLRNSLTEKCTNILDHSHLICLFGLSIGKTDSFWWEYIANILKVSKCKLIIFWKGGYLSPHQNHKSSRIEKKIIELFLAQTGLKESDYKEIKDHIFFGYNTDIFNIDVVKVSNIEKSR